MINRSLRPAPATVPPSQTIANVTLILKQKIHARSEHETLGLQISFKPILSLEAVVLEKFVEGQQLLTPDTLQHQ